MHFEYVLLSLIEIHLISVFYFNMTFFLNRADLIQINSSQFCEIYFEAPRSKPCYNKLTILSNKMSQPLMKHSQPR